MENEGVRLQKVTVKFCSAVLYCQDKPVVIDLKVDVMGEYVSTVNRCVQSIISFNTLFS